MLQAATSVRPTIDAEAFARDIRALRSEIFASLGAEDLEHLGRLERWGRAARAVGLLTAWAGPNPVSVLGLALGQSTRWLLMHHVGHKGYDRVPGAPPEKTSARFARGGRRFADFFDWIEPEAWIHEHNVLHHAFTSEDTDPDLIERNVDWVHELPKPARYLMLALLAGTWRATYYAPATLKTLLERDGKPTTTARVYREVALRSWLPFGAWTFGALPLLYAPLGPLAVLSALANSALADVVANVHTFVVVGPNHAGDDLYRWDDRAASPAEHLVRQVVSSTNYATGGDLNDYAHLFLNYQIEHHLFPDLPMRQYQRVAPKVKAICEKHGVPYLQEGVFSRLKKMADIFVGNTKMRRPGPGGRAEPSR
jgi:fatty acid desaturase